MKKVHGDGWKGGGLSGEGNFFYLLPVLLLYYL
jgi:hypothetical protein